MMATRRSAMDRRGAAASREGRTGGEFSALSRGDLAKRWEAIYGSPPLHTIKRPLLERAVSWHQQAKLYGGLSAKTRRQLAAIAEDGGTAAAGLNGEGGQKGGVDKHSPSLTPGSRLVREWRGRTHVVEVLREGFRWNEEEHASLSAIARRITGARWSGPRFFGL
jgi:Protein of unknown function (DUF2924)